MLVTVQEAKEYLRVDSADEDLTIATLLSASCRLCTDVARLSEAQWEAIDAGEGEAAVMETMKVAILYALGYLFEHREEADHHDLTLTLRSLLFAVREEVV